MREKIISICDSVCVFSLYALVFFIPISIALIEIFTSLAVVTFLIKKILKPDFQFLKNRTHLWLLLFFTFSSISLINSGPFMVKSLKALFFKWLEYILIFIIAEDSLNNPKRILKILLVFIFSSILLTIDSASQYFFSNEFIRHRGMTEFNKKVSGITASFQHANDFGAYLNIMLGFFFASLFTKNIRKLVRSCTWLIVILLVACLLLTFSRGSLIAFIAMFTLILILTKRYKTMVLLLFIIIILFGALSGFKDKNITTCPFTSGESWGRLHIWTVAIKMIQENPFLGKGVGTFMDYFSKYAPNLYVQYAHNCYLQIWAETGIFSLICFLLFIGSLLFIGIKKFLSSKDYVILGLLSGIFGFLIHSGLDTNLYSLQLSALFWLVAGVLAAKIKVS